jgi:SpoVK/Ycf46/Vps4 family AAA+-type ATPase
MSSSIQNQIQGMLSSSDIIAASNNVIAASNNDIGNSIVTNTLLNSMKTGQPLIDVITSLVFVSKFKNPLLKNVSIVFVLILGIIFHKITKSVDILAMFYEKLSIYSDPYILVQYIPFPKLRNFILRYNGNLLSSRITNKQCYFEIKKQYNLITILYKVLEKYPDVKRESLENELCIGYSSNPVTSNIYRRFRASNNFLSYKEYENKENSKADSIIISVENIIKSPPKTDKWYIIDDDIQFCWSITHNTFVPETSPQTSGQQKSISRSDTIDDLYYTFTLKSYNKSTVELQDYVDLSRKTLLDKVDKYETDKADENNRLLNSLSNKDYRGEIYEVDEKKHDKEKKESPSNQPIENKSVQFSLRLINTFCRPLESIFFKEKSQLMNMLENFKLKKGIYEKLPHRHKIGIMIYGEPGAGKTSLAVAICTQLRRNIIRVPKDKDLDDVKLSHILNSYKRGYAIILDELDTYKAFKPRTEENETKNVTDLSDENMECNYGNYGNYDVDYGVDYGVDCDDSYGDIKNLFLEESLDQNDDTEIKRIPHVEQNKLDGSDTEDENVGPAKIVDALKGKQLFQKQLRQRQKYFKQRKEAHMFRRKRWEAPQKLNIGVFLEAMDGISSTEERVVIAMTNHPGKLDPAIIRPGRFDIVINMGPLGINEIFQYFQYLFENFKYITNDEINEAATYAFQNKVSTSSLEQACIEKYSILDSKSLKTCIEEVHSSFKFVV